MFLGERLGIQDEVEVAEALLALSGEFNGLHGQDLVIACHVLGVYKGVMMREI